MGKCRILIEGGQGEYEEKKSRFIATLRPVNSIEEASSFIEEMKKRYWDARHNCSAYVIGRNNEITRCSDDGEPSGTAGRPMLEVLTGAELHNAAVVVTRYFGGTLLGTGGLVRAYTQAVKEGIANSISAVERDGERLMLGLEYGDVDRLLNLLKTRGLSQESSDYGADVTMELIVAAEDADDFIKEVTELTAGRVLAEKMGACVFLDKQ